MEMGLRKNECQYFDFLFMPKYHPNERAVELNYKMAPVIW
jgi:hypothetical protein